MIVSVVSQKGGTGKSSIARSLSLEFQRAGWSVLLADLDTGQKTSVRWAEKRKPAGSSIPQIDAQAFPTADKAIRASQQYQVTIIDGAPHATRSTRGAATASDLVIIPTGSSIDDLSPGVALANELTNSLNSENIVFALYKTTSQAQERESRETLESAGFHVLASSVPIKTGYIEALDKGFGITESRYDALNKTASQFIQSIADRIKETTT